jgi:hypothetical protein
VQEALNKITVNLQKPSRNSACNQKQIFKNQFFFLCMLNPFPMQMLSGVEVTELITNKQHTL